MTELRTEIEELTASSDIDEARGRRAVARLIDGLNDGSIRAASRNDAGQWVAHAWVKQGILLGFKLGNLESMSGDALSFFDKDTYPLKPLSVESRVRVVPGGSSVRTGSYLAPGVVCMPPMYVNVGAYVDAGSMVDSHALVGSCAQIGRNVHLSAAAQIGGVLEPVGAVPVVIEDNVFVGGGCGIYEGWIVRRNAVLAPGVVLTAATRVYDVVNERLIGRGAGGELEIPEGAVVVPGTRRLDGDFAADHGLSLYAPVIIKYRDESTDAATTLESALR